jgi:hypothetical protein
MRAWYNSREVIVLHRSMVKDMYVIHYIDHPDYTQFVVFSNFITITA